MAPLLEIETELLLTTDRSKLRGCMAGTQTQTNTKHTHTHRTSSSSYPARPAIYRYRRRSIKSHLSLTSSYHLLILISLLLPSIVASYCLRHTHRGSVALHFPGQKYHYHYLSTWCIRHGHGVRRSNRCSSASAVSSSSSSLSPPHVS